MNPRLLAVPALLLPLLSACSKTEPPQAADAGAPVTSVAAPASASPKANARDAGATLTAQQRATVLRELKEGRRLSRAKDWPGAIKAFERALAVSPDDARVLADLGWVAFQANDLARADSANKRALANAKEPQLRAPILYNVGRVAEAKGEKDVAKKAYTESLALRENAEVKKRLDGLGGSAPSGTEDPAGALACKDGATSIDALCKCLLSRDDLMTLGDDKPTCKKMESAPILHPRLSILEWGTDGTGERVHLLVVREGDKFRPVAELGRDYEPGAFGVHNEAEVKGGELQRVHGHELVVVKSEQHDNDANLAGIELCIDDRKLDTVCAMGEAVGSTKCAQVATEAQVGCVLGVEPDEAELDDETRKTIAALKKAGPAARTKASWSIAPDGTLTVGLTSGSRDAYPASLKPVHVW